jgi:hypothetical protein
VADLSKDRGYRLGPGPHHIRKYILDTSTAQTVYMSQPMIQSAASDQTYLRGWVDGTAIASNDRFIGICASAQTSVTLAATENTEVDVITWGLVGFPTSTITAADAGKLATMSDSSLVVAGTSAGANNLEIGYVAYVEDGYVYVPINGKTGGAPVLCV